MKFDESEGALLPPLNSMVLDATFSNCERIPYRQFELYQEMHWKYS